MKVKQLKDDLVGLLETNPEYADCEVHMAFLSSEEKGPVHKFTGYLVRVTAGKDSCGNPGVALSGLSRLLESEPRQEPLHAQTKDTATREEIALKIAERLGDALKVGEFYTVYRLHYKGTAPVTGPILCFCAVDYKSMWSSEVADVINEFSEVSRYGISFGFEDLLIEASLKEGWRWERDMILTDIIFSRLFSRFPKSLDLFYMRARLIAAEVKNILSDREKCTVYRNITNGHIYFRFDSYETFLSEEMQAVMEKYPYLTHCGIFMGVFPEHPEEDWEMDGLLNSLINPGRQTSDEHERRIEFLEREIRALRSKLTQIEQLL